MLLKRGQKAKSSGAEEESQGAYMRIGKLKWLRVVPRIGKLISLEFLAKRKGEEKRKEQELGRPGKG